jgi:hypothetical protein
LNHDYNYTSSYAKNVCHKLATGEILFNLDADNYLNKELFNDLRKLNYGQWLIPRLHGNDEGSYGRLGYTRDTFHNVLGYDETIVGMKGGDGSLNEKFLRFKYKPVVATMNHIAIQNTREQKDMYTDLYDKRNPPIDYPSHWGAASVIDYFGNTIEIK